MLYLMFVVKNRGDRFMKKLIINEREDQIVNLDSIPRWDRGLIDYKKYHNSVGQSGIRYEMTMQGTRGCPFQCFYCDVQHLTPFHRRRSVSNIVSEVEYLSSIGVKKIEFIDDAFNIHKKEFKDFFKQVISKKLNIDFYFQSGLRGDALDEEAIDLMVAGGTKSVNLSLESASPRLQKLMGKNLKIDKLYNNIQYMVSKYPRIILGLNAMHGFPTETEDEAQSTVDFITSIKWLHFAQLHNVRIFPNSRLEQVALENGVTKEEIEESLTMPYHLIPKTIKLNHDFSRKLRLKFVHDYVLNPVRLKYILGQELYVMNEEELKYKYQSIFPTRINSINDVLKLARLKREDVDFSLMPKEGENNIIYPKTEHVYSECAFRILCVDVSQFFTEDVTVELNVVEPPLGFMSILSYLNDKYKDKINGKIIKTGVDVNSFLELTNMINEFKPDLIAIRTLTYFKEFFKDVVSNIRTINKCVPIIAGGPHPTINPYECLSSVDIQACVIGEGEIICSNIVGYMLKHNYQFPNNVDLKSIKGIAFLESNDEGEAMLSDSIKDKNGRYVRYANWSL